MNERFFELKKDRQDRIINGAMQIFAQYGYRHASTDEMVAAASISKGLLFHYFKSKQGAYLFLYEYATRYLALELREAKKRAGCDFFEMHRLLARADAAALRKYPFLVLFLERADADAAPQAGADCTDLPEELAGEIARLRADLLSGASLPPFLAEENAQKINQILSFSRTGLMRALLAAGGEGLPFDAPDPGLAASEAGKPRPEAGLAASEAGKPRPEAGLAASKAGKPRPEAGLDKAPHATYPDSAAATGGAPGQEAEAMPPFHAQYLDRYLSWLQMLRRMNI